MYRTSHVIGCCVLALSFAGFAAGEVVHSQRCVVEAEILTLPKCALETKGGGLYVSPRYLRALAFVGTPRMAQRQLPDGSWAYVDRSGLIVTRDVAPFDNGASYIHHGLVRVVRHGKMGLADLHGAIVVPLRYDGIYEFDEVDHAWIACTGCHEVSSGDSHFWEGGVWFRLNQRGQLTGRVQEDGKAVQTSDDRYGAGVP